MVLSHIMEHLTQWQMVDPRLATILNIPLPPPMPGTPTAQLGMFISGGGAPAGGPPPAAAHGGGGAANDQGAPQKRDTSGVKLPNASSPPPGSNIQHQPNA
jgi:hypothetical protein